MNYLFITSRYAVLFKVYNYFTYKIYKYNNSTSTLYLANIYVSFSVPKTCTYKSK